MLSAYEHIQKIRDAFNHTDFSDGEQGSTAGSGTA